ncbi:MAG: bifunctional 5,10-methylenetetrahydrofolate dehydrogenase/5,10-methenyltetrahydrofolate cyclohydrolase [Bacilli bacterium]|nr:bifunctional 5,10-methylenetetrahydrofolate dehydrogenase/5,10-methenyltetrahydrofolate cyclohydrolase [Bacilli bacterium]
MELLDGKRVKKEFFEKLKEEISKLDRAPGLAVIQVGNDPASEVYVRQKEKMANGLGYLFKHIKLNEDVKEEELLNIIDELNNDDNIDGFLVQMPIPKHINPYVVQNRINYLKDVDGLTDINMGALVHNKEFLVACTPQGIMDLLEYYNIDISGKNVVIVGRSDLVGKPLASLMTNSNATVSLCHSKTNNLKSFTKRADILVVAVGKPNFIKKEDVKNNAVIIDVGINRLSDGSLCGDVDFESVKEKASFITPVPGGVGQMTVMELAKNTYKAYKLLKTNVKH